MARCLTCNWTAHDDSAHKGPRCRNGHVLSVVGVYQTASGPRCRACACASSKRYRDANLLRERARVRAAYQKQKRQKPPAMSTGSSQTTKPS